VGLRICTLHCNIISVKTVFFSCNFMSCRHFWSEMFMSCIFMSCNFLICPNFMSCNFMSCKVVRHFHVLLFHALHIGSSISCPAVSCPAILMVCHFHVQHFQSTHWKWLKMQDMNISDQKWRLGDLKWGRFSELRPIYLTFALAGLSCISYSNTQHNRSLGDKSFQAITCTGSDKQKPNTKTNQI